MTAAMADHPTVATHSFAFSARGVLRDGVVSVIWGLQEAGRPAAAHEREQLLALVAAFAPSTARTEALALELSKPVDKLVTEAGYELDLLFRAGEVAVNGHFMVTELALLHTVVPYVPPPID